MGQNASQRVPASIRLAHEVLEELGPDLDAERLALLRRKLPGWALREEQAGRPVTQDTLRAAALDLRTVFANAAIGGGKMGLADYPALRQRLLKTSPSYKAWHATFEKGNAQDFANTLKEHRAYVPENDELRALLFNVLLARPDAIPTLSWLLENMRGVPEQVRERIYDVVLTDVDAAFAAPGLRRYLCYDGSFLARAARQGRVDAVEIFLDTAQFSPNMARALAQSLAEGTDEVRNLLLERCLEGMLDPEILGKIIDAGAGRHVFEAVRAREAGYQDRLCRGMDMLLSRALMQSSVQRVQKILDAVPPPMHDAYGYDGRLMRECMDYATRNKPRLALILYDEGLWDGRDVPQNVQALVECRQRGQLAVEADKKTVSDGNDQRLREWQFRMLESALAENHAEGVKFVVEAIFSGRGGGDAYRSAIHEGLVRGSAAETIAAIEVVIEIHDRLRTLRDGAPAGEAADALRTHLDVVSKGRVAAAQEHILLGGKLPPAEAMRLVQRLDLIGPQNIFDLLSYCQQRHGLLRLGRVLEGSGIHDVPGYAEWLAAPERLNLRQLAEWQRLLPGRDVPEGMLRYSPRHIKQDLMMSLVDLFQRNEPGGHGLEHYMRAYKLCAVFRSEDRIMRYIERWGAKMDHAFKAGKDYAAALADSIKFPEQGVPIDPAAWGDALLQYGPEMARFMSLSDRLRAPAGSVNKMREEAACYYYNRGSENKPMAAFCYHHKISQAAFDQALALMAQKTALPEARVQRIPDFDIDGASFGMPGARFYRMRDDDFRGLFLGKLVDCCQHIDDGNAAWCSRHGFQSEEGGFYAVETKEGEIIGECWAWRGTGGQLVLDSLETLGKANEPRVTAAQWAALIDRMKEELTRNPGDITAMLVGTDGNRCPLLHYSERNPGTVPYPLAAAPGIPLDHKGYGDSAKQYLLWRAQGYIDDPRTHKQERNVCAWAAPKKPAPAQAPAPAEIMAAGEARAAHHRLLRMGLVDPRMQP